MRCNAMKGEFIKFYLLFAAIRIAGEIGVGAITGRRFEEIRFNHKCADARVKEVQRRRRFENGADIQR